MNIDIIQLKEKDIVTITFQTEKARDFVYSQFNDKDIVHDDNNLPTLIIRNDKRSLRNMKILFMQWNLSVTML